MSEKRFNLIVTEVDQSVKTNEISEMLADLMKINGKQLERILVNAKLFTNKPQQIKSNIPKERAEAFQRALGRFKIVSEVQECYVAEVYKSSKTGPVFTCPACGVEQPETDEQTHVCKECGIVKEKFEEAERIRKIREDELDKLRSIDSFRDKEGKKNLQQQNEQEIRKQVRKEYQKKKRRKMKPLEMIALAVLAIIAVNAGVIGFLYMQQQQEKERIAEAKAEAEAKRQQMALLQSVAPQLAEAGILPGEESVTGENGGGEPVPDEVALANPYRQLPGFQPRQALSVKQATQLLQRSLKMKGGSGFNSASNSDQKKTEEVLDLYDKVAKKEEKHQATEDDYELIKEKTSSIEDAEIKNNIMTHLAWKEVKEGRRSVKNSEYASEVHFGEEPWLKQKKAIINLARIGEYDSAIQSAMQVDDPYFRALYLSDIMEHQVKSDKEQATKLLQKILMLKVDYYDKLGPEQKALILNILSKGYSLVGIESRARQNLIQAMQIADQMPVSFQTFNLLIQINQDQREYGNMSAAHFALEFARHIIEEKGNKQFKLSLVYTELARSYALVFDFNRANEMAAKINDYTERTNAQEMVSSIRNAAWKENGDNAKS